MTFSQAFWERNPIKKSRGRKMSFSNWQKKAGEASDKVFETIGYAISSDYDGKYKKVIGGAEFWLAK